MVDECVKLLDRRVRNLREVARKARVNVASARSHDQSRCRRQPHSRIDAFPLVDRGHAGPRAQVRENHAAGSRLAAGQPFELFHQEFIRQPVESVAPHGGFLEPARNRHDLGDARHVVMKARVETGDLRQAGSSLWNRSMSASSDGRWSTSSGQIRCSSVASSAVINSGR